ncbi:unnamed protein product, partial [Ixodes persulcatus]
HQERGLGNTRAHSLLRPKGGSVRRLGTRRTPGGTQGNLRRRLLRRHPGIGRHRRGVLPNRGEERGSTRETWRPARFIWFWRPQNTYRLGTADFPLPTFTEDVIKQALKDAGFQLQVDRTKRSEAEFGTPEVFAFVFAAHKP